LLKAERILRKVKVISKSWRFSRHGSDFNEAPKGTELEVSADLAAQGILSGDVEFVENKMRNAAPENKSKVKKSKG
jgi:hypothetical protein